MLNTYLWSDRWPKKQGAVRKKEDSAKHARRSTALRVYTFEKMAKKHD